MSENTAGGEETAKTQLMTDESSHVTVEENPSEEAPQRREISGGLVIIAVLAAAAVAALIQLWVDSQMVWVNLYQPLTVACLAFGVMLIAVIDAVSHRITNLTSWVAFLVACSLIVFAWMEGDEQTAVRAAVTGVAIGVVVFLFYVFSADDKAIGGGDVKIIPSIVAVTALLHPLSPILWPTFMLLCALLISGTRKRLGKDPAAPLGPSMMVGLVPVFWHFSEMSQVSLI